MTVTINLNENGETLKISYDLATLVALPVHLAKRAIRLAEIIWANDNLKGQLREDLMGLVETQYGPVRKLGNLIDRPSLLRLHANGLEGGIFHWEAILSCDECSGSGTLRALGKTREHEAVCSCCDGTGNQAVFALLTDDRGVFVDWDLSCFVDRGEMASRLAPMPTEAARELSRSWHSW